MTLRERIENSPIIFFLGTLLLAFLAGIGTYESILRIANLAPTSRAELSRLERDSQNLLELQRRFEATEQARDSATKELEKVTAEAAGLRQRLAARQVTESTPALPARTMTPEPHDASAIEHPVGTIPQSLSQSKRGRAVSSGEKAGSSSSTNSVFQSHSLRVTAAKAIVTDGETIDVTLARHIHRLRAPETIPRLAQPCYKRVCEDTR